MKASNAAWDAYDFSFTLPFMIEFESFERCSILDIRKAAKIRAADEWHMDMIFNDAAVRKTGGSPNRSVYTYRLWITCTFDEIDLKHVETYMFRPIRTFTLDVMCDAVGIDLLESPRVYFCNPKPIAEAQ